MYLITAVTGCPRTLLQHLKANTAAVITIFPCSRVDRLSIQDVDLVSQQGQTVRAFIL